MMKSKLFLIAGMSGLAGCSASGLPELVASPETDLSFMGQYGGRLSDNGVCITLVTGEAAMQESVAEPGALALIAVGPGFSIEADETEWTVVAPDGTRYRKGDIVAGEGGLFPNKARNPDAPLADTPVREGCPDTVIQVNSMRPVEGIR